MLNMEWFQNEVISQISDNSKFLEVRLAGFVSLKQYEWFLEDLSFEDSDASKWALCHKLTIGDLWAAQERMPDSLVKEMLTWIGVSVLEHLQPTF